MNIKILLLFQLVVILFSENTAVATGNASTDLNCPQSVVQMQYSSGLCSSPVEILFPLLPDGSSPLAARPGGQAGAQAVQRTAPDRTGEQARSGKKTVIYFFWGKGCPHCEDEREFLERMKSGQPSLEIREYEVWNNRENAGLMAQMLRARGVHSSGVPVTFVSTRMFSGFTPRTKDAIEKEIVKCSMVPCSDPSEVIGRITAEPAPPRLIFTPLTTASTGGDNNETSVTLPFLGDLEVSSSSLPVLTLLIAAADSFNPCAFFVLLTLLGMLAHARSRNRMLLIGGIFVFFSGLIYFLFMAAWFNLFLVMGHVAAVTTLAGSVSLLIAAVNIKDFFLFRQGVSLSIPDSAKPKLFDRMRKLLRSDSLLSLLTGATLLAIAANFYELLCTAGFPMVFTRILTLNNLSPSGYYLYLLLYNIVYVVPLFIIVVVFSFTLGQRKLSEWQGRVLKLLSGSMMLGLGIILLVNPALLNSVKVSLSILAAALGGTLLVALLTKKAGS